MRHALIGEDEDLAIAGALEILGDDDDLASMLSTSSTSQGYEILGDEGDAAVRQRLITLKAKREAAADILARNAKLLKNVKPTRSRIFPLGFVSDGPIEPGDQAIIISRPQVIYRGERLIVPSDIAGDFTIDDVKVGKNSQFVAEGAIPARSLQENAWGVHMQLDTAQISQNIVLSVTNISGAARTFRATLLGSAVE